jgi:hypothetical protein
VRSKQPWHVLQERDSWSYLANNPDRIWPEVAIVVARCSFTCCAEWLARESSTDDIHRSAPSSPVEGSDVIPDWRVAEDSVSDALLEDADTVRIALDVTDDPVSEQDRAVDPAACSSE